MDFLKQEKQKKITKAVAAALTSPLSVTRLAALKALTYMRSGVSTDSLAECLKDQDPDVRIEAADTLGKVGDAGALAALLEALNDREADVVINAVRSMGRIPVVDRDGKNRIPALRSTAVDRLIHILCEDDREYTPQDLDDEYTFDPHWDVQLEAVRTLGLLGDSRAIGPLFEFLTHTMSQDVTECVMVALSRIKDDRATDMLITLLNRPESRLRRRAAGALGDIKDNQQVTDALLNALMDEDPAVRINTARSLIKAGKRGNIISLLLLLKDQSHEVRAEVAALLGETGGRRITEQLVRLLNDPVGEVRRAAAGALGKRRASEAAGFLIELLNDPDEIVTGEAANALGRIGNKDALNSLVDLAKSKEQTIGARINAVCAIGGIGGTEAGRALKECLKDDKKEIAAAAMVSLEKTGLTEPDTGTASDVLVSALKSDNPFLVEEAILSLGKRGKANKSVSAFLRPFLFHNNQRIRLAAIEACGRTADMEVIGQLCGILQKDNDSSVRERAAGALGSIGSDAATDALLEALQDGSFEVRKAAVISLGLLEDSRAVTPLLSVLYDIENFDAMRREIAQSLKRIGGTEIIDELTGLLQDSGQRGHHWIAIEALAEII